MINRALHLGTTTLGTFLGLLVFLAIVFTHHFIHPKAALWMIVRIIKSCGTVMTMEEWLNSQPPPKQ